MRRLVFAVLSLAFLATGCRPTTTELTEEQKAAIADEVNALVDGEWIASTDPVDFEKLMSLVHNTDEAVLAFNGGTVHSYATMRSVFGEHFSTISREPATITDSMTVVLAPDVVYVIRAGTFVSIDTALNSGPLTPFTQTLLWVLEDGAWKVLFGHVSHGPPVAAET
jgi:ketosteroid isomerase-like protein